MTVILKFISCWYSDAVLLKYKSSGLHVITKTISTWLRNNITSGERNNGK